MPVIVQSAGIAVVIVQQPRTVSEVDVTRAPRVIGVASTGIQGPPGAPGAAGGGFPAITFNFSDASPASVMVLTQNMEFAEISLEIETPFNGAAPQIMLGTAASPGLLMTAAQNDPTVAIVFETAPRVELPSGTAIILTVVPGSGATQGRGQLVVSAVPV